MSNRPGPVRTDLVAEMQQANLAAQQAAHARMQEAQRAERARLRKARLRTVLTSVALLAIVVVLAGIGKLAFDAYRVSSLLEEAQAQVQEGTPEALAIATTSLERGLEIDADHPETLGTLALVHAQQAIDGSIPIDTAEATLASAQADAEDVPETAAAAAIVSVLRGDYESAAAALPPADPDGSSTTALGRAITWARAQIALHDLDQAEALAPAITAVDAVLAEAPGWDRNHRAGAALYFRAGRVDEALARLATARELRPSDTSLLVDEALYKAVLQRDLDEVDGITDQLVELTQVLGEQDAARARLARAIVRLHQEGDDDARSELGEACEELPAPDRWARALALEAALSVSATPHAKACIEQLPAKSAEIHQAWALLDEDHVVKSLEQLAALPQGHPRVALGQGLALVEQGRFKEAHTWLGRAQETFPERPLLEAAIARVDAQIGEPREAAERLEKLSSAHPGTPRVWTGLAEALIRAAEGGKIPASAEKPLEQALEREAHPAKAAHLLGRLRKVQSVENPKLVPKAVELHRQAVKLRGDWIPAYREALGLLLADVGSRDEARELLQSTADAPTTKPTTLLLLAELAAEHATAQKQAPPAEIATWLAEAAQRGAPAPAQAYSKARIALMAGTPEGVAQARVWIGPLLQANSKDLEARLLYVEILRREGNIREARASLQTGTRKTPNKKEGRLYFLWAQVERDAGKERRAASHAYKGWRLAVDEPRPANELLEMAAQGIEWWSDLRNSSGARSIGLGLTRRVPYRAEAWVLRSKAQLDDEPDKACESASRAVSLDEKLADAHLALAECKLDLRDRKEAAAALEKAAELTEDEDQAKALRRRAKRLR